MRRTLKTVLLLFFSALTTYGQNSSKNLESEMERLKTETVLIVNSQAIDEYPIWSAKSDFIACNVEGKWYKFRLTNIELAEAEWRKQSIGVLTTQDAFSPLTSADLEEYRKVSKFNSREATTSSETKIELKMDGMTVSLIVTKKGEKSKTLWTSGGENCHSLVISPDEKYVAYLCEMTGLLLMKLK